MSCCSKVLSFYRYDELIGRSEELITSQLSIIYQFCNGVIVCLKVVTGNPLGEVTLPEASYTPLEVRPIRAEHGVVVWWCGVHQNTKIFFITFIFGGSLAAFTGRQSCGARDGSVSSAHTHTHTHTAEKAITQRLTLRKLKRLSVSCPV